MIQLVDFLTFLMKHTSTEKNIRTQMTKIPNCTWKCPIEKDQSCLSTHSHASIYGIDVDDEVRLLHIFCINDNV